MGGRGLAREGTDQHERRSEQHHVQKVRRLVPERALLQIAAIPDAATKARRLKTVIAARLAGRPARAGEQQGAQEEHVEQEVEPEVPEE